MKKISFVLIITIYSLMSWSKDFSFKNIWNPISIYGTNSSNESITENLKNKFLKITGQKLFLTDWSSANNNEARIQAAWTIAEKIWKSFHVDDRLMLYGHSHGGNVAILAINLLIEKFGFNPQKIILITLNTPVLTEYQLYNKINRHINIYNPQDIIQIRAGANNELDCFTLQGCASREFKQAINIPYRDARESFYWFQLPWSNHWVTQYNPFDCSNRHCGNHDFNINLWFTLFIKELKKI